MEMTRKFSRFPLDEERIITLFEDMRSLQKGITKNIFWWCFHEDYVELSPALFFHLFNEAKIKIDSTGKFKLEALLDGEWPMRRPRQAFICYASLRSLNDAFDEIWERKENTGECIKN